MARYEVKQEERNLSDNYEIEGLFKIVDTAAGDSWVCECHAVEDAKLVAYALNFYDESGKAL